MSEQDWPWWRGPQRNGHANLQPTPPTTWSDSQNILWKVPVPGKGHGSPTVVGDRIFLATSDPQQETQSVLCFQRTTGKPLWQTQLHQGSFPEKLNTKATQASSTVACDGTRLFINFVANGAAYTSALDLDGQQLWQQKICDYVIHQGYGSSPAIYGDAVIVSADNKSGGAICAFRRTDGEVIWKRDRPELPNYASPVILTAAGKTQLVFTGCDLVTSLNPETGATNWEMDGATTECVTSTITDGQRIFTSGGYPTNHLAAVEADGSKKVTWSNGSRVYVPSMIEKDGYLYATLDAGIAMCWRTSDGQEQWKHRLGGTFSSSCVLVNDLIYATNETGETFIFKANPEAFEQVSQNKLGEIVFATPAICGGKIYQRFAVQEGDKRQEYLVCIADES
ncbi:MAG: PQQ-binding-like beta-propeller repeat protein [Planctomycetales bacterium]|nr:PQQ-binding-like beta-propeller repeat protein [Planctomycetales bacterium]